MAHYTQEQFIRFARDLLPEYFAGGRVLEIGSQDVNGSPRYLFNCTQYIGIDVSEGPGVDVVCKGEDYDAPDNSFDAVISFEVMEHNPEWKNTFQNMIRLVRPGGLILMSCATLGRPEHGTTRTKPHDSPFTLDWNYYRNLTRMDFESSINLSQQFTAQKFFTYYYGSDLFFLGIKIPASKEAASNAKRAIKTLTWRYFIRNMLQWDSIKKLILINLMGEKRYFALHGLTSYGAPISKEALNKSTDRDAIR